MSASSKKITTEKFEVTLLEKGIVEDFIRPGVVMEVEDITSLKKHNYEQAGNKPYVILVTAGELISFSKEARELAASKEFIDAALAKALLINSTAHRIIGNFYLKVNKPYLHTRIFSDRTKALNWLRTFIK
ncbi:MAG: hypothetical protein Q8L81_05155 [Bacteroidota bacterium]|nr:hypothetical protein [Bacteroidota bacterium]